MDNHNLANRIPDLAHNMTDKELREAFSPQYDDPDYFELESEYIQEKEQFAINLLYGQKRQPKKKDDEGHSQKI